MVSRIYYNYQHFIQPYLYNLHRFCDYIQPNEVLGSRCEALEFALCLHRQGVVPVVVVELPRETVRRTPDSLWTICATNPWGWLRAFLAEDKLVLEAFLVQYGEFLRHIAPPCHLLSGENTSRILRLSLTLVRTRPIPSKRLDDILKPSPSWQIWCPLFLGAPYSILDDLLARVKFLGSICQRYHTNPSPYAHRVAPDPLSSCLVR